MAEKKRKCPKCNTENSIKDKICSNCNAKLPMHISFTLGCLAIFIISLFMCCIISSLIPNRTETTENNSISNEVVTKKPDKKPDKTKKTKKEKEIKENEAGINKTIKIGYMSYIIGKPKYQKTLGTNPYLKTTANAYYLVMNITVKNNDKEPRMIPPFKLVDENGNSYQISSDAMVVAEKSINFLDSLNPEVSKSGLIAFDVPKGKDYKIVLDGGFWNTDNIVVDLGLK